MMWSLIRDHVPRAVLSLLQPRHPCVRVDLRAAVARADRVGVGDAVGIDAAFVGVVERADEVLLLEQWVQHLRLGDRDDVHVHAEVPAARLRHAQPIEALGRVGQHQPAGQVDAALLPRLGLDLPVEVDRVLLQARHVGVAVQRVHPARRVPRRPGGQLLALQQHDVGPAGLREVIQHAGADDTASDHDHLC